jgi:hypothetical protein
MCAVVSKMGGWEGNIRGTNRRVVKDAIFLGIRPSGKVL